MTLPTSQRPDDPSAAPESGTGRDDTSGNQTAAPQERPPQAAGTGGRPAEEKDPCVAGEEK